MTPVTIYPLPTVYSIYRLSGFGNGFVQVGFFQLWGFFSLLVGFCQLWDFFSSSRLSGFPDPLPTPRTPLFRRGSREVVHRLRGGFYNAFHGPPPGMGGRRAVCDGIVVVLVVADPLWGTGPVPPLRGRAVTVSKFLCEGQLQGVSYLINGFGMSIIEHAIESPGNCFGQFGGFLSRSFFFTRATSSGKDFQAVSSISSVRCAEVVGVTSRSRERHRESAGAGRTFRTRSARM